LEEGGVDAALQDQILNQAPDGIVCQHRGHRGAEAETAAQSARHVVLAAALPDRELARGVNAAFAGIETKHDFAQAQTIPAPFCFRKMDRLHVFVTRLETMYSTISKCGARCWICPPQAERWMGTHLLNGQ
jgi:hypothetical protein